MHNRIPLLLLLVSLFVSLPAHAEHHAKDADSAEATDRVPNKYTGWAVIKRNKLDPSAAEDDWIAMRDMQLDDAGAIIPIVDDGKPTGYSIQLIEITYQKTNTTVLKLGLIEDESGKTITYIWGEPAAGRLGMNLRWMQVGLTKAAADS